jgi:hypothetical protein
MPTKFGINVRQNLFKETQNYLPTFMLYASALRINVKYTKCIFDFVIRKQRNENNFNLTLGLNP